MLPERSLTDVLQDILKSLQDIVRAEARLAKVELKHEASELARSSAWLAAGVVLAVFALAFALWAGVYGLAQVMPLWAAALIAALALAVVAWMLVATGLRKAKEVRPVPERTVETMKENLAWLKPSGK
jgi:hypothetical protein